MSSRALEQFPQSLSRGRAVDFIRGDIEHQFFPFRGRQFGD